jgi:hypothetical protein
VRTLNPEWFTKCLQQLTDGEVLRGVVDAIRTGESPDSYMQALTHHLTRCVVDEVPLDCEPDDPQVVDLVSRIVVVIPAEVGALMATLPGMEARMTLAISRDILALLDGTDLTTRVVRAKQKLAEDYLSVLASDVFGRTGEPASDEMPLLPLRQVYVEPHTILPDAARAPVLSAIDASWTDGGLTILAAPFGFGKSLTCKVFGARLADAWLRDPEGPFPVIIDCPAVLSTHVATLEEAIVRELGSRNIPRDVAERILSNGRVILILDSFDEVVLSARDLRSWFNDMRKLTKKPGVQVLLASRPNGYETQWLVSTDKVIEIAQFAEADVRAWLGGIRGRRGFPEELTFEDVKNRLGEDLVGTPILLLMAAWGWSSLRAGGTRAALYAGFVDKISLGKWSDLQDAHPAVAEASARLEDIGGRNAFKDALAALAYEDKVTQWRERRRAREDSPGLPKEHVRRLLRERFARVAEEDVESITRSMCLSMFLQKGQGHESVRFTHRSFREFLTAQHIVNRLSVQRRHPETNALGSVLADTEIDGVELTFLTELLDFEENAELRSYALRELDRIYQEGQELVFAKDVTQHTWDANRGVYRFPAASVHGRVLRVNSESIAAALRRFPDRVRQAIGSGLGSWGEKAWAVAALFDDQWRVLGDEGMLSVAYRRDDGALGYLADDPLTMEMIRTFAESFPDRAMPIMRDDGYLVVGASELRIFPQSTALRVRDARVYLRAYLELGRVFAELDKVGWAGGVLSFGVDSEGRVRIPFAIKRSEDDEDLFHGLANWLGNLHWVLSVGRIGFDSQSEEEQTKFIEAVVRSPVLSEMLARSLFATRRFGLGSWKGALEGVEELLPLLDSLAEPPVD